jgi:molybdate transport system ATP-binding protein
MRMAVEVDVSCRRGKREISARFTASGGLTALFGPSGAGKTTILNMIAGLIVPETGRVAINGHVLFDRQARINIPPHLRRLGYVFQDGRLFPHLRVRANLLYGHQLCPPADRWLSCEDAIAFLGIEALLDRWPATLSGGESQRVAIGRALLSGARFLLMDEPLSSLDEARRDDIMAVIRRIRDELKLPILYVSHDRTEIDSLADHLVILPGA